LWVWPQSSEKGGHRLQTAGSTAAGTRQVVTHASAAPIPPRLWLDWVIVFLAGLTVYVATCAPDVLIMDSAVFQVRVAQFPPTPAKQMRENLLQVHPLHLAVAKPFTFLPIGTLAYRANLASAWFGAMTLAALFVLIRLMTGNRWAAAIGTLSLGLGHSFWAFAVMAEYLTLLTACLTFELLALALFARTGRKRWFMLAGFINGLALSTSPMGALSTPVYLIAALIWRKKWRLRWLDLLICAGLWLVGAGPYLFIIAEAMIQTGDVAGVIRSATTEPWPAANTSISLSLLVKDALWLALQYPTLLLLLGVLAIRVRPVHKEDHRIKLIVLACTGVHFAFAARFPVPNQYTYFIGCYSALGALIGLGAWGIIRRRRWTQWAGLALAVAPVGVYVFLPSLVRRFEPNLFTGPLAFCEPYLAYSDPYKFFFQPWQRGNDSVRRYSEDVLRAVPQNGVLIVDYACGMAIDYLRTVEGKRPDLEVFLVVQPFPLGSLLKSGPPTSAPYWVRPVYSLGTKWPHVPELIERRFRFVREGAVYRVEPPIRWDERTPGFARPSARCPITPRHTSTWG